MENNFTVEVLTCDGVLVETRNYEDIDTALEFVEYINHCTEWYASITDNRGYDIQ